MIKIKENSNVVVIAVLVVGLLWIFSPFTDDFYSQPGRQNIRAYTLITAIVLTAILIGRGLNVFYKNQKKKRKK